MSYSAEAAALDRRVLETIERWSRTGAEPPEAELDELALEIFAHQVTYNSAYALFAAARGYAPDRLPASWRAIPAVPAAAFKEASLCTFPPETAALHFVTSGTTAGAAAGAGARVCSAF